MLVIVALDLAIILIGTAIPASRLNATLVPDVQHLTTVDVSTCIQHTVDRENFTLKIIRVRNFRVNKFSRFRSICEIF